eukprot:gb/GECG01003602.1/.p1 GENE.gb/GECG01003602.1/~~gb/GECG01003602.1/.p1  ORF type:complete len:387 (+),score=53.63 gb/GECG01003602.1/:1-1161(+)
MSPENEENVEIGFVLVVAAGMCAALGGMVVFIPSLVYWASDKVLSISLAFSAGVMIYVSFVEILGKSFTSFEDAGLPPAAVSGYGTLSLFVGILTVYLLGMAAHWLQLKEGNSSVNIPETLTLESALQHPRVEEVQDAQNVEQEKTTNGGETSRDYESEDVENPTPKVHRKPEYKREPCEQKPTNRADNGDIDTAQSKEVGVCIEEDEDDRNSSESEEKNQKTPGSALLHNDEAKALGKVGLLTALAIALHNFPEGLATFVATLDDPKVGGALAVSIGIHNVPEGICVAVPIYYATGSKCKAFWWAFFSGITEPVGALIGWLILRQNMTDIAFGIIFGVVAGMMIQISFGELIPTSREYDTHKKYSTAFVMFGMAVMALSLVLFEI